ncbi:tyrosine-protein phosphatase [Fictibacillus aquaticus]|uniref:Tyrosine-protein phosphatase n=1 Tax=Fictibacillus aquaticus TaxID=2021314 RepID=A0A235F8K7_9BACL|nr:CpsB/CapC family capsule biosynthesis tyrosine phosphatase [Fictibacillus aquaticus]OYD57598.1 tyrosine protein phosphatase [Fictibacillus aquaticus]
MIDIHCHILPGVDDGPAEMSEAIELAEHAVQEGITTIIATPHHNSRYSNNKSKILDEVQRLNKALTDRNIPLNVLPGQEIRIIGEFLNAYETDELLTVNNGNQYVLVELPFSEVPHYTEQLLFDIQLKGLVPVIVHPERNTELMNNPDRLYKLVKNGALTQITSGAYVGKLGRKVKSFSRKIIEHNLAHFIASDAHDIHKRGFYLRQAYEQIQKEFGTSTRYYFEENAELLTAGKNVMKEVPEKFKKRSFAWFS